jgi:ligand-binding SRPBCC domain-containing protein
MTTYKLFRKQFLPISKYRAWDFFSSPRNLLLVTPRNIDVQIIDISGGERMYEGQIIKQRFNALPFVRMDWDTLITDVIYYECFTLRQIKGPYRHWTHKHCFRSAPGGIELSDEIEYALPLGLIGRLANSMMVKRQLGAVFNYREKVVQEYFGVTSAIYQPARQMSVTVSTPVERVGAPRASS